MKGLLKILLLILIILVLIFLMGRLFFPSSLSNFVDKFSSLVLPEQEDQTAGINELNIVFPNNFTYLEPMTLDQNVKQINLNVLEPLVRTDRNLNTRPSLALTWGLIEETKWEFILRPGVLFHDGSEFDAEDVLASFNRARLYPQSQIKEILATIKQIQVVDSHTLMIETFAPDPLLLKKLSLLFIIPSEYEEQKIDAPIGTGPYKFENREDDNIVLSANYNYWGREPHFERVICISKPDVKERLDLVISGQADFLAFVPQEAVSVVTRTGMQIKTIPSLEVQFLMYNFESDIFKDINARLALFLSIDREGLAKSLGDYVNMANQFVSNGVFGFNPNINAFQPDYVQARDLVLDSTLEDNEINIGLPVGSEFLGEYLDSQLSNIGVASSIKYLDPEELIFDISLGDSDLYFLGFKSELGDSSDFINSILAGDGSFNLSGYSNPEVDRLLAESLTEMDAEKRLFNLQSIMKIAVEKDIVGIPLFEFETIYGYKSVLNFEPRIDGFIYFNDIYNK